MSPRRRCAQRQRRLEAGVVGVVLVLAACASSASVAMSERPPLVATQGSAVPTPTSPAVPAADATARATPSAAPAATAIPTPTPTPTLTPTPAPAGPCDVGPLALAAPKRPIYGAELRIDPATGVVEGSLSIEFTPDLAIDDLYLRLWPNGPRHAVGGVAMTVSELTTSVSSAEAVVTDPTIVHVPLDEQVPPGQTVSMQMEFDLVVPIELQSRISGGGSYMRLGTVLPILPWEPGVGWALEPATALFAESVTSPVADYRVKVTTPDGFDVLASGIDDGTGTWLVEQARDFALTVGRFTTVTGTAMAPRPVQVTVGVHESMTDDPDAYLAKVIDSLEQFSARWGQYPWPSLSLALTPGLRGGIEFPTHIMQGPDTIGRTTSHEVGHMFFYSLVGNNQGRDPWLDEGLASYAEFTYEGVGPGAYPIPGGGVGQATQPMTFWESRADIYYRSVYGQTGFALQQLGTRAEVDCALARFVADNAHDIATPPDFVEAFEPTFPDVVARLAELGVALSP